MTRLGFTIALALAGVALDAQALGRLADVQIIDRATGTALETHYCRGEYWVAGTPGGRYSISIRNNFGERLLAVTSVDGVNVVSGDTAGWQQTGYVFGPYQGYEISGWRKSDRDVATFEFTASPNSYAERTGRPANVGVIGVALFRERAPARRSGVQQPLNQAPAPAAEAEAGAARGEPLASAPAAHAKAADASEAYAGRIAPLQTPKLGTGHGAREASYVEHTDFNRERESPNEVIRIRYDSFVNLVAMGVIRARPPLPSQPNAFPESPVRYVPDPPGYPGGGLR
jgi:hypothetical protein